MGVSSSFSIREGWVFNFHLAAGLGAKSTPHTERGWLSLQDTLHAPLRAGQFVRTLGCYVWPAFLLQSSACSLRPQSPNQPALWSRWVLKPWITLAHFPEFFSPPYRLWVPKEERIAQWVAAIILIGLIALAGSGQCLDWRSRLA